MKKLEWDPDNSGLRKYIEKENGAGLVAWYGWTTSAYHSKHYIGRIQVGQGETGKSTVKKDLWRPALALEELDEAALDREKWRQSVVQCVHVDADWIT